MSLKHIFIGLAAVTLTLNSCKLLEPDPKTIPGAKLELGDPVTVTSQTIAPSGGVITVSKPGDALDGLVLTAKSGSFSSTQSFTFGHQEIKSQAFGDNFHAITPAITISGSKEYANHAMTLKVPCTIPDGDFAMVFSYDPTAGELEALPLLAEDSKSVTAVTRHFAHASTNNEPMTAHGKGGIIMELGDKETYVVLSMPKLVLMNNNVSTKFLVGTNNFEFVNRGSVIAPKGHCMGQTYATMYYYRVMTLKNSMRQLYGRFDNDGNTPATPKVWEDDQDAYRLCSVLQEDAIIEYGEDVADFAGEEIVNDSLKLMAFKLAMMEDAQPQLLTMFGQKDGHAVMVIGATGKTLNLCDPNNTSAPTALTWSGDHFAPYTAGGLNLTKPFFRGRTSLMKWSDAKLRWQETLGHRIGNGFNFPQFIVQARDTTEAPIQLNDGWITRTGTPNFPLSTASQTPIKLRRIYLENGDTLVASTGKWIVPSGSNRLGFYVTTNDTNEAYVGFVWRTVVYNPAAPDPDKFVGQGFGILPLALENEWKWHRKTFKTDGKLDFEEDVFEKLIGSHTNQGDTLWSIQMSTDLHQTGSLDGDYVKRGTSIFFSLTSLLPSQEIFHFPAVVDDAFSQRDYGSKGVARRVKSISDQVTVKGTTFTCYRYETEYRTEKYGRALTESETNEFLKGTSGDIVVDYVAPGFGLIEEKIYRVDFQGNRYLYSDRLVKSFLIH